jgi:hypothetical protein
LGTRHRAGGRRCGGRSRLVARGIAAAWRTSRSSPDAAGLGPGVCPVQRHRGARAVHEEQPPMCGARAADLSPCDRCRRPSSCGAPEESYRAGRYTEIASAVPVRTAIARIGCSGSGRWRPREPGTSGQGRASGGLRDASQQSDGAAKSQSHPSESNRRPTDYEL